ncbi:MAG TPA: ABC transporter permease [Patescibacteria group bacterium]|nr:ABC transporter permease [Patescibacteria group bacterium]
MKALHAGLLVIFLVFLVAIFAPLLAPFSPESLAGKPLQSPDKVHWLGTDRIGQDIFSQLVFGSRVSLLAGAAAAVGATLIGGSLGMAAGFFGGRLDRVLMRGVDIFIAIPHLPFMLLLAAHFPPSLATTLTVLILFSWAGEARLIRSQVLSLRQREYMEAARMAGAGKLYLIQRYLLPELAPLLLTQAVLRCGWGVLAEAGLAFIGLGDPTQKSWGLMLHYALDYQGIYFTTAWQWWLAPPGLCISILILALTWTGFAMEERWNPTLKEGR